MICSVSSHADKDAKHFSMCIRNPFILRSRSSCVCLYICSSLSLKRYSKLPTAKVLLGGTFIPRLVSGCLAKAPLLVRGVKELPVGCWFGKLLSRALFVEPVFGMGEERLVSFCWLSVSLSAMLLEAFWGEPLLSSCSVADIWQAEGKHRRRVWRLRQVPWGWREIRSGHCVGERGLCRDVVTWRGGLIGCLLVGWVVFNDRRMLHHVCS